MPDLRIHEGLLVSASLIEKLAGFLPPQARRWGRGVVRLDDGTPKYFPISEKVRLSCCSQTLAWAIANYDPQREFLLITGDKLDENTLFLKIPFPVKGTSIRSSNSVKTCKNRTTAQ